MSEGKKIRMLLVDDEEEFLDATSRALERRGFKVDGAADAEMALRLIQVMGFDVAVLDVKLPGLSGVELFRRIRARWPWLPVILLTGHGTVGEAFTTSREGVVEYLTKPCSVDVLARIAREAVERAGADPAVEEDAEEDRIRVLLVDDDVELLQSLSRVLGRRNMDVTTAEDGVRALAALEERFHDVVVLDVKMPGMDGLEVLRRIKERSGLTEVLLLTGHPSVPNAFEGVRAGAFDYLLKPHSVDDLARMIRAAYRHRWIRPVSANP